MAKKKKESKETAAGNGRPPAVPPRLRELYSSEVQPALMKEFGITNVMSLPRHGVA